MQSKPNSCLSKESVFNPKLNSIPCILYCLFPLTVEKSSGLLGRGHRKKITSHKLSEQTDGSDSSVSDSAADDKHLYKVNQEGRYICQLCQKTFKTVSFISVLNREIVLTFPL